MSKCLQLKSKQIIDKQVKKWIYVETLQHVNSNTSLSTPALSSVSTSLLVSPRIHYCKSWQTMCERQPSVIAQTINLDQCSGVCVSAVSTGWSTDAVTSSLTRRPALGAGDPALWLYWHLGRGRQPKHYYPNWELDAIINAFGCSRNNVPEQLRGSQTVLSPQLAFISCSMHIIGSGHLESFSQTHQP